ncbi:MAG: ribonuclease III [Burkholderiales bacterium]|nr:ribonuclease III [Burkholderiales bacterium]
MDRPPELEARIGYRFSDAALLEQALTHRSYGASHNERLEFLGDSVLGCIMAEALYTRFPGLSEGQLTRIRAALVCEDALCDAARALQIGAVLRLGEGERMHGANVRASILADALEALFGAVFVDGGYAAARGIVLAVFGERLAAVDPHGPAKDPKTRLQEFLQGQRKSRPEYRVVGVSGAAHRQTFEVECIVEELDARATGSGTSRQRAEQAAAAALLASIGE